jgi:RNA polymerase sigma-70 factor (ECF subfamily)
MAALLKLIHPPALTDDDTIKQIAQTDRQRAIGMTVAKFRDRLFNHALYIVKDHQEAYDVVQEVFIKAMRETRFFLPDFKMKAWLFRVTSNLCFNIRRDKKRRGAILQTMQRPTSTAPDQFNRVFGEQRQGHTLAAMEELSRDHREILSLRYYSDLSYAEIADTLAIKLGTVMSRLSRAKGRLMEAIGDPGVIES